MPEYIDREAAYSKVCPGCWFAGPEPGQCSKSEVCERLHVALITEPDADVAPVVRGSWCLIISDFDDNALQCSICGKELKIDDDADISEYRACPFCTAIMDGGNDNV